jgi:hypothetical protein
MGIFGVNMPSLYGEGAGAFLRLQLEILSISDDESIFACEADPHGVDRHESGMLTDYRYGFARCGDVVRSNFDIRRPPFTMANKGLRTELLLEPTETEDIFLAPLNCERGGETPALCLRRVGGAGAPDLSKSLFCRGSALHSGPKPDKCSEEQLCLSNQRIIKSLSSAVDLELWYELMHLSARSIESSKTLPSTLTRKEENLLLSGNLKRMEKVKNSSWGQMNIGVS